MNKKNNRGSITLITVISVVLLLVFLMSTYLILQNKKQTQRETSEKILALYNNGNEANEKYESYFKDDMIPINSREQLLKTNGGIEYITIGNKLYRFSNNAFYTLMADIELETTDIWEPLNANEKFTGEFIGNGYTIIHRGVVYSENNNYGDTFPKLTIQCEIEGATIKMRQEGDSEYVERSSIKRVEGTVIEYEVSADKYKTITGSHKMGNSDYTLTLGLTYPTFTITGIQDENGVQLENARVEIGQGSEDNLEEYTSPYKVLAAAGTEIFYRVTATGYETKKGSITLNDDEELGVILNKYYIFSINPTLNPTSENCDISVKMNRTDTRTIEAIKNTAISWIILAPGYKTDIGLYIIGNDYYTLNGINYTAGLQHSGIIYTLARQIVYPTFTINSMPQDATVIINGETRTSLQAIGGTNITWTVSKEGYRTESGIYTMTSQDYTQNVTLEYPTLIINPTPSYAAVTINGETRNSLQSIGGTQITWSVSANGYKPQTGTYQLGTSDYTQDVTLEYPTFEINSMPEDATVTINGETRSSLQAIGGSRIAWSVSREGYRTESGTYTMTNEDCTQNVTLEYPIFTINPTLSDATVTINGETRTSLQAIGGTNINWEVTADGYEPQTGTYQLGTSDYTQNVTLKEYFTFSIDVKNASGATVMINNEQRTSITVTNGTSITWSVTKDGYNTASDTVTVTGNSTKQVRLTKTTTCNLSSFTNTTYNGLINGGSTTVSFSSTSTTTTNLGYGLFDTTAISGIDTTASINNVKLKYTANKNNNTTISVSTTLYNGTSSNNIISTKMNKNTQTVTTTSTPYTKESTSGWTRNELTNGVLVFISSSFTPKAKSGCTAAVTTGTLTLSGVQLEIIWTPVDL